MDDKTLDYYKVNSDYSTITNLKLSLTFSV